MSIHQAHVRRGVKPREDDEQAALFDIVRAKTAQCPDLAWLFHCPNEGSGSAARGARMKRMGLRSGVWDLLFDGPSADGKYARLRVEMKTGTNGLSDEQVAWAWHYAGLPGETRLALCYSALDAWSVIADYFGLDAGDGRYERWLVS